MTNTTCDRCPAPATHIVTVMVDSPRRFTSDDGEPGVTEEIRRQQPSCEFHLRRSSVRGVRRL
jgi:hypothetical protein